MLIWLSEWLTRGAPVLAGILREHPLALAAVVIGLLVSLAGYALLSVALWPERLERAASSLGRRPVGDWVIGLLALAVPVGLVVALVAGGIRPGRFLLLGIAFVGVAIGLAACARWLGMRMLAGRGALAQTALGLALLLIPMASPFGVPVLAVAAPLGLGAWLAARR